MRALILAAGRGSRMGDRTDDRPKCMVELAGRPLLYRQVAALRAGGASEIGIVRGYLPEAIKVDGARYFQNERWQETNMVMSLAAAAEWLAEAPVIVSYSDIFYRAELVRRLAAAPGELVVAYDRDWLGLWSRRFADPLSDAETFRLDDRGRLLEIGGKTRDAAEIQGQYMGLLKFTPAAWNAVRAVLAALETPARDRLDVTSLLRRLLERGAKITTAATNGQWGEVDQPSDIALYESMARAGELSLEE
jgi:L-glutamine-phosphate cytidylyltransferase